MYLNKKKASGPMLFHSARFKKIIIKAAKVVPILFLSLSDVYV